MPAAAPKLFNAFSEHQLKTLADAKSFRFGSYYAVDGSVRDVKVSEKRIAATVVGQHAYEVRLGLSKGEATWSCSCPVGRRGSFCKHCVAVALTAHQKVEAGDSAAASLKHSLAELDHERLVQALLSAADANIGFARQLQMAVAGQVSDTESLVAEFEYVIDEVFEDSRFVDYYEMPHFASRVEGVIDAIEQSVIPHDPLAAMRLSEYVNEKLIESIQYVDDSDGYLSSLSVGVSELHLEACERAKVEPVELAETLFALETEGGDLGTFDGALQIYGELLGDKGHTRFEELVREAWNIVCQNDIDPLSSRTLRIKNMMLMIAERRNDVDLVVHILSQDLSHESDFVRIVQRLHQAERFDEAFEWASRGLETFTPNHDFRLFDLYVEECFRRGINDKPVDAMWSYFDDFVSTHHYARLRTIAKTAGVWDSLRPKAIERIRADMNDKSPSSTHAKRAAQFPMLTAFPTDASTLVSVLLSDGEVDEAWQEAQKGGCFDNLWMELATHREQTHPADVVPIYQREAERAIRLTGNENYAKATDLLVHIQSLMSKANSKGEFNEYIAQLAKTHKAKRNLMKLFKRHAWTP